MAYLEPAFGDADNNYPREPVKFIDIFGTEMELQNTIASSEWFAEYVFSGHWRVNPEWQIWWDANNPPGDPPPGDPDPL